MDIQRLFRPHTFEEFHRNVFGMEAFHGQSAFVDTVEMLASGLDLGSVVWREHGRWGDVRLARADTRPADCPYFTAPCSEEVLATALRDGYTVVVNDYHLKSRVVADLCASLGAALHTRCAANLYVTAAGNRGLDAHYDDTDVFVFQIEGSKHWSVLEGGRRGAMPGEVYCELDGSEAELSHCTLNPGDVFYIPRGVVHRAQAADSQSVHLTISVEPKTWLGFLHLAVSALAKDHAFLRSTAGRLDRECNVQQARDVVERLAKILLGDETCIDAVLGEYLGTRPVDAPSAEAPVQLSDDSVIRAAAGVTAEEGPDGTLVLHSTAASLELDKDLSQLLTPAFDSAAFRLGDLGPNLKPDERTALARMLLQQRFVDIVDETPSAC